MLFRSFNFEAVRKEKEVGSNMGLDLTKEEEGPIAMTYDMDLGWVAEALSPTSGQWKRKACEGQPKGKAKDLSPMQKKRNVPFSLTESDQKKRETKKQRVEVQERNESEDKFKSDGGGCCKAAPPSQMSLLVWNCRGLGLALVVRSLTDVVKVTDLVLVFLAETKASQNRIKGL